MNETITYINERTLPIELLKLPLAALCLHSTTKKNEQGKHGSGADERIVQKGALEIIRMARTIGNIAIHFANRPEHQSNSNTLHIGIYSAPEPRCVNTAKTLKIEVDRRTMNFPVRTTTETLDGWAAYDPGEKYNGRSWEEIERIDPTFMKKMNDWLQHLKLRHSPIPEGGQWKHEFWRNIVTATTYFDEQPDHIKIGILNNSGYSAVRQIYGCGDSDDLDIDGLPPYVPRYDIGRCELAFIPSYNDQHDMGENIASSFGTAY